MKLGKPIRFEGVLKQSGTIERVSQGIRPKYLIKLDSGVSYQFTLTTTGKCSGIPWAKNADGEPIGNKGLYKLTDAVLLSLQAQEVKS